MDGTKTTQRVLSGGAGDGDIVLLCSSSSARLTEITKMPVWIILLLE
jgi:microcompartment protein CcmK/EutM